MDTIKAEFTLTDTFAGEANYSWARSTTQQVPRTVRDTALVRRAKLWAGFNGQRARVDRYGDEMAIYPAGSNLVIFISFPEC